MLCGQYMLLGLSYNEFWHGDHDQLQYWRMAKEAKLAEDNQKAWLQGVYYYNALTCALAGAFAGKGKKPPTYLNAPLPITELERKQEQQRKEEATLRWFMQGQKEVNKNG